MPNKYIDIQCKNCVGSGSITTFNGNWIRYVREADHLSLRNAARQLKISAAFLSDIELGKRNANEKIIKFFESL